MKALLLCACLLFLAMPAFAAGPVLGPNKCALEFVAPVTNEDGSPLIDLKEYRVYVSATKGTFTAPFATIPAANPAPAPNTTVTWDCRTAGLTAGQKWVTVRAVDLATNESDNADLAPEAIADGGTKADGAPFVYKPVRPAAPTGSKPAR